MVFFFPPPASPRPRDARRDRSSVRLPVHSAPFRESVVSVDSAVCGERLWAPRSAPLARPALTALPSSCIPLAPPVCSAAASALSSSCLEGSMGRRFWAHSAIPAVATAFLVVSTTVPSAQQQLDPQEPDEHERHHVDRDHRRRRAQVVRRVHICRDVDCTERAFNRRPSPIATFV